MTKISILLVGLALCSCGEFPQQTRDREQYKDTIRWLERQEIDHRYEELQTQKKMELDRQLLEMQEKLREKIEK